MNDQTNETQSEPDDLRPQLVARAVARANSARQAIDKIASLDAEIVQGVFERTPAEVRDLHVDNIFESEATAGDLAKGIDHVFANLRRMAAETRLRDASDDTARTRIILLLDDIQILHRQLDFLQKFLLASDLLSELARSAYANKYRSANSVRGVATTESDDGRADKPAASDAPSDSRQSASMEIIVTCGHCAKQFTAPESLAGKQVKCLNCQQPLLVPQPSSSPSEKRPAARSAAATADASAVSCPPEIPVSCPRCRRRFLAQSWLAGKSVDCPSCGQTIRVTHEGSQISMNLACDIDPLSGLPDLADLGEHFGSRPVSTSRLKLPQQTYSAWKPARGFDEDELPSWAWYAIGAAVGFVALVLLAILASSLWRGSYGAHASTTANLDADTGIEDSASSEPNSDTPPGKNSPRLHTSADGGYSIFVPGPVSSRTQMDYLNRVIRHVDAVELPKDVGLFEVSYADQSLSADVRVELANLWQAAAATLRASATETVEMDYKGNPALAIRFVSENPLSPTGRVLLVAARRGDHHRLYMIVRSGPKGCAEGDEAEMIFQSFGVLP